MLYGVASAIVLFAFIWFIVQMERGRNALRHEQNKRHSQQRLLDLLMLLDIHKSNEMSLNVFMRRMRPGPKP